jgi:hypothetical protein
MAKRVTITFLVDDQEDHAQWIDEFHDDVQSALVAATGVAATLVVTVQEGVTDGPS